MWLCVELPEKLMLLLEHLDFVAVQVQEPGHLSALTHMAQVCSDIGDFERAVSFYNQATRQRPRDPNLLLSKGWALEAVGDVERAQEAKQAYEAALALGIVDPGTVIAVRGGLGEVPSSLCDSHGRGRFHHDAVRADGGDPGGHRDPPLRTGHNGGGQQ